MQQQQEKRPPFSGNLARSELHKSGGILMAMLVGRMAELGQSFGDMAKELGVSSGYLHQLRNGNKEPSNISDDFATSCAQYLGIPRLSVLLAAGRIKPTDMYVDPEQVTAGLDTALQVIAADPEFGASMPADVFFASNEMRMFVVRLYERATGKVLLQGRVDHSKVAEEIERIQRAYPPAPPSAGEPGIE